MVSNQVTFSGKLVSCNCVLEKGRSGVVAIDTVYMSVKLDIVALDSKTTTNSSCGFDLDNGNEFENNNESLQEAYEKMYTQWLKVCAINRALGSENQELRNPKIK